ncbi:hemolysin III family protein [Bacteroidota bacterium]
MADYTEISRFTKKEELANAASHFAGALLAVAGLALMIVQSARFGNAWHIISTSIFGASMIMLYMSSAMTHYLKQGPLKNIFFSLDRIAIYILIAGTYTPFALVTLRGALGWTIFGIEWACAIAGSTMVLAKPVKFEKGVNTIAVVTYAIMGWLIIIAIVPLINNMVPAGWILIIAGGLFYTIGIFFYKKGKFLYHHLVWHLLVIGGTLAHFFAIYYFVIPR